MRMLARETLTRGEQEVLSTLQYHAGYIVLKKLAQDAIRQVTSELISLDQCDPNFSTKLSNGQLTARAMTEAFNSLWASVEVHGQAALESQDSRG